MILNHVIWHDSDNHLRKEFLSTNYRSTKNIIEFVDQYANLDPDYQTVRIAGKPSLGHGPNAKMGAPILGMFRDSIEELSLDLSKISHNVFGEMESKSKVLEK